MWFFSKKEKKQDNQSTSGSEASQSPVKIRTMADDLAEKAGNRLPDLPKEARPPKSLSEPVPEKLPAAASSAEEASQRHDVLSQKESLKKETVPVAISSPAPKKNSLREKFSKFSIGGGSSLAKTQPSSSPSQVSPSPVETSPFLSKASNDNHVDSSKDIPSQVPAASNLPENSSLSQQASPDSSAISVSRENVSSSDSSSVAETKSETLPLQHLEKKQAELRTGNWPIGDEKKPKQNVMNPPTVTDSSDVFSGPKKKPFSADNVIIAEEPVGKKTALALGIVMLLAAAGGGSYYFWQTRIQHVPVSVPASLQDILPQRGEVDVPEEPAAAQYPFSVKESNPFVVDVETETISTLRQKLLDDAKKMQEADMRVPVRFTVTDKNNTPIAFFIFASVFNLGLSGDLLNSLGNDFSLYLYLDNGAPRLGLVVTYKDAESARALLKSSERTLPISLKNLFLEEELPAVSDATFGNGLYESVPTRFFNFDTPEPLSIDYAFMRDYLIIGTSRDTARALIDEVLKP